MESFPMLCDKKLIIIKDSKIFSKAKEEVKEYWLKRLDNIPEYVILIFDEKEIDKRSESVRYFEKREILLWNNVG